MKHWYKALVLGLFFTLSAAPIYATSDDDLWGDTPAKVSAPAKKAEPAKPAPKIEPPKKEEPKPAPKAEAPKPAPAPVAEQPKKEEPKAEEPKKEEPKAEAPKPAPTPVAEQPKKEEPKAEESKKEEPKAEAPKPAPAPAPKAEEPKKEEPKAEAPKPAPSPKKEPPKQEKKDSINVKAPIVLDTAKTTNVEQPKPVAQSKSGLDPMYKALIISASFIVVGGVTALVFDMMAKDATSGTPKNPAEYKDGLDDAGQYQSVRDIGLGVLFTGVVGAGLSFCF